MEEKDITLKENLFIENDNSDVNDEVIDSL